MVTEVTSRAKWFCLLIPRVVKNHENGGNKMAKKEISLEIE
jgi:hypothetical protein